VNALGQLPQFGQRGRYGVPRAQPKRDFAPRLGDPDLDRLQDQCCL